jgi:hypothetical protein
MLKNMIQKEKKDCHSICCYNKYKAASKVKDITPFVPKNKIKFASRDRSAG